MNILSGLAQLFWLAVDVLKLIVQCAAVVWVVAMMNQHTRWYDLVCACVAIFALSQMPLNTKYLKYVVRK